MKTLEDCREKWRRSNDIELKFDGRRIIPPKHCLILNKNMQACLKRTKVDELLCREEINLLKQCMDTAPGVVVPPPK